MKNDEMMRDVIDCCEAENITEYAELLHVLSENDADADLFAAVLVRPHLVCTYLASRARCQQKPGEERDD